MWEVKGRQLPAKGWRNTGPKGGGRGRTLTPKGSRETGLVHGWKKIFTGEMTKLK